MTMNDPRKKQKSFFMSLKDKSSTAPAKSNDLALEMINYYRFVFEPRYEKLIKKHWPLLFFKMRGKDFPILSQ